MAIDGWSLYRVWHRHLCGPLPSGLRVAERTGARGLPAKVLLL